MWAAEIIERWLTLLPTFGLVALAGAVFCAVAVALRARMRPVWAFVVLVPCVLIGAAEVWRRLSLVDDAFISFRYARNLLRGDGLVFNPGEAVLGITNLGWTLVVAGIAGISGLSVPHAGLILAALAWVALIGVTWRASLALRAGAPFPPLAAAGVAVSWLVCSFGSTGLETLGATALVVAGVDGLIRRQFLWAGLAMVLACVVRLDQGIFLLFGAFAAWRAGGIRPFLASTPLLALVLAWTWWTYGEPVPNTAHAKGDGAYWSQGGVYLLSFWLTTQLLWQLPLALVGLLHRGTPTILRDAVLPALLLWNLYVAYVGGDFMIGRFLIPCVPLVLLASEQAVALASGWRAVALGAWLGTAAYGLPLVTPRSVEWYLADEGSIYPVRTLEPLEVDHHSFLMGNALHRALTAKGLRPTIAAHGIGMIGYYSDLPLVDFLGLTDPVTAKRPVKVRSRPGHEKGADPDHVRAMGVVLAQKPPYWPLERYTRLRPRPRVNALRSWHVWQWDPEVIAALRKEAPELGIFDLEGYVANRLAAIPTTPPNRVKQDLELLDRVWYGEPGIDMTTREAFVAGADPARVVTSPTEEPADPPPAPEAP